MIHFSKWLYSRRTQRISVSCDLVQSTVPCMETAANCWLTLLAARWQTLERRIPHPDGRLLCDIGIRLSSCPRFWRVWAAEIDDTYR